MKYTIQNGAKPLFSERVKNKSYYLLPLLVVLAGILFFALSPHHPKSNFKPSTLGVYTINTPNGSKDNKTSGTNPSSDSSNQLALAPQNSHSGSSSGSGLSSSSSTAVSPTPVGGMGGGAPAPAPTSTGIVVCGPNPGPLPITCTATQCIAPVLLAAGQKAILYTNGTCLAVDP